MAFFFDENTTMVNNNIQFLSSSSGGYVYFTMFIYVQTLPISTKIESAIFMLMFDELFAL